MFLDVNEFRFRYSNLSSMGEVRRSNNGAKAAQTRKPNKTVAK